jgi:hypothetical protein
MIYITSRPSADIVYPPACKHRTNRAFATTRVQGFPPPIRKAEARECVKHVSADSLRRSGRPKQSRSLGSISQSQRNLEGQGGNSTKFRYRAIGLSRPISLANRSFGLNNNLSFETGEKPKQFLEIERKEEPKGIAGRAEACTLSQ